MSFENKKICTISTGDYIKIQTFKEKSIYSYYFTHINIAVFLFTEFHGLKFYLPKYQY